MSKDRLLSDEELRDSIVKCFSFIELTPSVNTVDNLEKLINTQKRLYAESVIGEDEHYEKSDPLYKMSGEPFSWAERNQLRAEQRDRIK